MHSLCNKFSTVLLFVLLLAGAMAIAQPSGGNVIVINNSETALGIGDSFAEFDYESSAEFEERDVYEIIDYMKAPEVNSEIKDSGGVKMNFSQAIKLLMNETILES